MPQMNEKRQIYSKIKGREIKGAQNLRKLEGAKFKWARILIGIR